MARSDSLPRENRDSEHPDTSDSQVGALRLFVAGQGIGALGLCSSIPLRAIRRNQMPRLRTWSGRSQFSYTGSVARGVQIRYGSNRRAEVSAGQFAALLRVFARRNVDVGTSRTTAPRFSLGAWLQQNVRRTAIASYVGPILLAERRATRSPRDPHQIQFP